MQRVELLLFGIVGSIFLVLDVLKLQECELARAIVTLEIILELDGV